jgi:enoyl-CoA hydratase/carnithine racemase
MTNQPAFTPVSGLVRCESSAGIATITLCNGPKRNALTLAMLEDVAGAIRAAARRARPDADGVNAILLHGEGPMFCSGFDLDACHADANVLRKLLAGLAAVVRLMRDEIDVPVVVAAHGGAIAGGCAMLGGADVVIADAQATFGYPVTMLGLSPAVSAPNMRRAMSDGATRARLLQPSLVTGAEATRLGLVHESVATAAEVLPRATAVAQQLAAKPAGAARITKAWLAKVEQRAGLSSGVMAAASLETSIGVVGTPEERSRLAAFVQRSRSRGNA